MNSLASELKRAVKARIAALRSNVRELRGALGPDRSPLKNALGLIDHFCSSADEVVEKEWSHSPDAETRISILRPLAIHIVRVSSFVEDWLSHGARPSAPLSLLAAIARECDLLGLPRPEPIVAAGAADNFVTFTRSLKTSLFQPLGAFCPPLPNNLDEGEFALVTAPRFEGASTLWRAVTVGHELAHLVVASQGVDAFDLLGKFDFASAMNIDTVPGSSAPPGPARAIALLKIAEQWLVELTCDAYAVRRFGPGGVAGLSEFLETIGATDKASSTHPHARLRTRLMLDWLGPTDARLAPIVEPWRELITTPSLFGSSWVKLLDDLFIANSSAIWDLVCTWPTETYDHLARADVVIAAKDALALGRPPDEFFQIDQSWVVLEDADVVNAAWLARVSDETMPFERLADKALDTNEFLRRWASAGGVLPEKVTVSGTASDEIASVLTDGEITRRVHRRDERRLVVTPLLPKFAAGAGLDVRLGNKFIVFVRSRTASFDPLRPDTDPRSMQNRVELDWGEKFVLHPNELVLASTLEYFVFPPDLTAQVITRSSYGRLGLLSATAVQVHPDFHGCLTLELVNLGVLPLELTPGERVAQLVVTKVTPIVRNADAKYHCPTGPEFSKVRADAEGDVLRRIREAV